MNKRNNTLGADYGFNPKFYYKIFLPNSMKYSPLWDVFIPKNSSVLRKNGVNLCYHCIGVFSSQIQSVLFHSEKNSCNLSEKIRAFEWKNLPLSQEMFLIINILMNNPEFS